MLKYVLVLEELHVVVPDPLREREREIRSTNEAGPSRRDARKEAYLQQVRRNVKGELLGVVLLKLHALVKQHVGAVRLTQTQNKRATSPSRLHSGGAGGHKAAPSHLLEGEVHELVGDRVVRFGLRNEKN